MNSKTQVRMSCLLLLEIIRLVFAEIEERSEGRNSANFVCLFVWTPLELVIPSVTPSMAKVFTFSIIRLFLLSSRGEVFPSGYSGCPQSYKILQYPTISIKSYNILQNPTIFLHFKYMSYIILQSLLPLFIMNYLSIWSFATS